MKKSKIALIALIAVMVLLFASCGGKTGTSGDSDSKTPVAEAVDYSQYAEENDMIYSDATEDIKSQLGDDADLLTSIDVVANDNAHIEVWTWNDVTTAGSWFQSNKDTLAEKASSNIGSNTTKKGSYTFTVDGETYKLSFNGNVGVYAYGDKDALDTHLSAMGLK